MVKIVKGFHFINPILSMYHKFFEEEQPYVGFFKFPEDHELVPGHLVMRKNIIKGQLYRVPEDIIENVDLPLGLGINTSKTLTAIGVFRLKDRKDYEISIFGIQIVSGSSSQLGFYEVICSSMIVKLKINSIDEVFPEKLVIKISGLEEWFEKKAIEFSQNGKKISISSGEKIIENLFTSDQIKIDLECYANFNFKYRDNIVKEIVAIAITFKSQITLKEALKWEENLRRIFSLFFRKQLRVEEVSFFITMVENEYFYTHSDTRDFYKGEVKHRNEAVLRYSDTELFKNIISKYINLKPNVDRLLNTYFLIESNHSLYSENAFLTWIFELDSFIKKDKQQNISQQEVRKSFSKELTLKLEEGRDPLLQELFHHMYSLANEKAKFFENSLQSRLVRYFGEKQFFYELVSNDPEVFFDRVVKTRNYLAHPRIEPHEKVLFGKDLYIYQDKLRLIVYCLILLELGMDEQLLIDRLKNPIQRNTKPLK